VSIANGAVWSEPKASKAVFGIKDFAIIIQ